VADFAVVNARSTSSRVRDDPLIRVKLCNRSFNALLDTGSSISLVNSEVIELLDMLNIKKCPCETNIMLASG
jgi:hypothetical protein